MKISRRCIGLNKNLILCKKNIDNGLYCEDHKNQFIKSISFFIFTVFAGFSTIYSFIPIDKISYFFYRQSNSEFIEKTLFDQIEICKNYSNERKLIFISCDNINKYVPLATITRSMDLVNKSANYIKITEDKILDLIYLYINFYNEEKIKIDSISYFKNEQNCDAHYLENISKGYALINLYYSSFINHIKTGDINSKIIYEPTYLRNIKNIDEFRNIIIKPYDFINIINIDKVNNIFNDLDTEKIKLLRDLSEYLIQYKDYYLAIKEDLFINERFHEIFKYKIIDEYDLLTSKSCKNSSASVYFSFMDEENKWKQSYWEQSIHYDMFEFWLRRDLDGSINYIIYYIELLNSLNDTPKAP